MLKLRKTRRANALQARMLKSGLAVAAMAATAVAALPGSAYAAIQVENVQSEVAASNQCMVGDGSGSWVGGCNLYGVANLWNFESVYPDAPNHAYANVRIRSSNLNECLTVLSQSGPTGYGQEVSPRPCDGSAAQEWASTRSAAGYLNYFNFQYRVCLNGSYSDTWGDPKNGCNANGENYWEDWSYA